MSEASAKDRAARLEIARAVWLRLLEAARRMRPIVSATGCRKGEQPSRVGLQFVTYTALDSWHLLDSLYQEYEKAGWGCTLGAMPEADKAIRGTMGDLLAIASIAAVMLEDPFELKDASRLDHWQMHNELDRLAWNLEERVGGDWSHSDPSMADRWAGGSDA